MCRRFLIGQYASCREKGRVDERGERRKATWYSEWLELCNPLANSSADHLEEMNDQGSIVAW